MLKKLMSVMALVMAVLIITPDAEAKRFGGGKSWGKSQPTFKKQPSQTNQQANQQQNQNNGTAANTGRRSGMMGGLLGGLLAGGLFAALLGGGAFEGLQMMDILLFALIAFVAVRFLRGLNQQKAAAMNHQPAQAYQGPQAEQQWQQGGFASASQLASGGKDDVPFNPPAGFDANAFLEGARGHFDTLQRAWNDNKLEVMQEYLSIELYNALAEERRSYGSEEINSSVVFIDAELVRADHSMLNAEVSVKFTGKTRDEVSGQESDVAEVWHLERKLDQANSPWLIVGIEA
ncbi:Tim44 domain-containing protein [Agarivorans sp. JK6]|uniref:Tim44 domain-containing protein n=1 Tax=Agarivorans sp. JK6 TaxID=2997426 RepID=UPI003872DB36